MKRRILWLDACLALAALWAAGLPAGPALAAMVLLPPLSWCLTLPAAGKLETTLRLPATADKGGEIPLTVQVRNPTRLPIGPVRCRIALGNELTGETATVTALVQVPARGVGCAKLRIQARYCGYLRAQVVRVQAMDWFGLLPGPAGGGAEGGTVVLPEMFPVRLALTVPPATPEDSLDYAQNRLGSDYAEPLGLRDYRPGDNLRAVHWKLSSKVGRLVVREPSLPVQRRLLVYWDKSPAEPAAMDAMAETAASLCRALCQSGYAYHLAWGQEQEVDTMADFLEALPRMLRDGGESARLPQRDYGRLLYLSARPAPPLPGMTALLWGPAAAATAGHVLPVSPEHYREDLQTMELDP